MKKIIAIITFLCISSESYGQLRIANGSKEDIYVSIGYVINGIWYSEGWWKINIGKTETILGQPLTNKYYYYRAVGKTLTWEGSDYFYIAPNNAFKIQQNSLPASLIELKKEKFNMIDVGNYTEVKVTLTSNNDFPNERVLMERGERDWRERDWRVRDW